MNRSRIPTRVVRLLAFLLVPLAVVACAPVATGDGPVLAVINAPAESRVPWLADAFEARVADRAGAAGVRFASSAAVRFEETHRDFFRSRAPLQAAFLARRVGADLAGMLGAPVFERQVQVEDGERMVRAEVKLEMIFVDPRDAAVVGRMPSRLVSGWRSEPASRELPDPEDDPLLRALAEEALEDLAPHAFALAVDLLAAPDAPRTRIAPEAWAGR